MRMSCNGCRVLRKGCGEDCSIRPCLRWIKDPESQGNATLFLAKFYGRAGLINLITEGSVENRPAIFRSLLYEACGRFVNPTYGSVGLLWEGKWNLCQAAVEAVLKGAPLPKIPSSSLSTPPFIQSYDIRHVGKNNDDLHKEDKANDIRNVSKKNQDLHRVNKVNRPQFKRSAQPPKFNQAAARSEEPNASHSSGTEDLSEQTSVTTSFDMESGEEGEVELELTLGFEPVHRDARSSCGKRRSVERDCESGGVDLGLDLLL